MLSRAAKLRLRRRLRLQKKQLGQMGVQAEMQLERNLFKRLERLVFVRRFIFSWMLLMVLLTGIVVAQARSVGDYYQVDVPVAGGAYNEGILGQFTNASPIYATSVADASVAKLVFSGLLKYDNKGKLVGDLAESWKPNALGDVYTVRLKPDLVWHDDAPLTAHDVAFTFNVIKNPDARSPLRSTWEDIKITAKDDNVVVFELPNPLASFPEALTTGVLPRHVLAETPMADMRSSSFNTVKPIGSGPFTWSAIEVVGADAERRQERIALKPFKDYIGGEPRLGSFTIRTFRTPEQMIQSFREQEITAMTGLASMPEELRHVTSVRENNLLLNAQVMSFFRTSHEILKDATVRRALVRAIDPIQIMRAREYPTRIVSGPLLQDKLGGNAELKQFAHNQNEARKQLDKAGWRMGQNGIRTKGGKPLSFSLHTKDTKEYAGVAEQLKAQWRAVGVDMRIVAEDDTSLQNTLAYHSYDALLYGIAVGSDPDVFVYWHSSQADERLASRLNFSEYKSDKADASLEDARTRLDEKLRTAKMKPFLQAWRNDAPALGLYQPRLLYVTRGEVYGLTKGPINGDAQRFSGIENWMIRTERRTPAFD